MNKNYPKKSLGQNFLIDNNIIKKIVDTVNIDKNTNIIEIGPGTGNLTNELLKKNPKKIILIEKDFNLSDLLKKKYKNEKKVEIINKDFLNIDDTIYQNNSFIVFGNLPYNVSSQILAKCILTKKWLPWYSCLVFMFQKEMANRIIAQVNSKDYGRLSILSNWRLDIIKHFDISKNCFNPSPKVESTLLSFTPIKKNNFNFKNPRNLEKITRIFFSNRRKMINKPLLKVFGKDFLINNEMKINLSFRPGAIDRETYYKLTKKYEEFSN